MAAHALHHDVKNVAGCHARARLHGDFAAFNLRPQVDGEGAFDRIRRQSLQNFSCAAAPLLCLLKAQLHGAWHVVFQVLEHLGGTQQHGHMPIVTAGMHDARCPGAIVQMFIFFMDGQGIHICPQGHHVARV